MTTHVTLIESCRAYFTVNGPHAAADYLRAAQEAGVEGHTPRAWFVCIDWSATRPQFHLAAEIKYDPRTEGPTLEPVE